MFIKGNKFGYWQDVIIKGIRPKYLLHRYRDGNIFFMNVCSESVEKLTMWILFRVVGQNSNI